MFIVQPLQCPARSFAAAAEQLLVGAAGGRLVVWDLRARCRLGAKN